MPSHGEGTPSQRTNLVVARAADVRAAVYGKTAIVAGLGGAVKYISMVIRTNDNPSRRRFILLLSANIFISSFCGMMGLFLVATFTKSLAWYGLAAGMFGYIGTQGLDIALLSLRKKITQSVGSVADIIPVPPSARD